MQVKLCVWKTIHLYERYPVVGGGEIRERASQWAESEKRGGEVAETLTFVSNGSQ